MRSLQTAKRPHGPVIYKDLIALSYTTNRSQEGPFWGEVALPSVESERRVVPPPIQGVIRHRGGPLMPLGRPWRRGVPDERGQHRSPQSPSGACPTTTPSARAQMRSTIRCGTPSEAGGHAPSKRVGVVPIIVDGVGVGLAIDQRPARVWDPKDVPEGEHRQRSLNQEQAKESQPGALRRGQGDWPSWLSVLIRGNRRTMRRGPRAAPGRRGALHTR